MGSTLTLGLWNLWSPCVPYPAHILYPEVSTRAVDVLQAEVNICANPLHGLDFQAATHVLSIGPWGWQTKSKTVGWYIHNYIEEEWWDWQKAVILQIVQWYSEQREGKHVMCDWKVLLQLVCSHPCRKKLRPKDIIIMSRSLCNDHAEYHQQ